ncbi:MAG: hypothetical protein RI967_1649 [Planctomycetota bacterium]|jgi:hypothetical protein
MTLVHRILALASATLLATACGSLDSVGEVELVALGSAPLRFETAFREGVYAVRDAEDSFWFSTVPLDALYAHENGTPLDEAVFLHAQLLWTPEAGKTPVSESATNLVTRVVVVSRGKVGVYGGAAFARLEGELGEGAVELDIRGGTLSLLEHGEGFHDLLSPAGLTAVVRATPSATDANRWRRAVSQFVTNAIGRSTWVDARARGDAIASR